MWLLGNDWLKPPALARFDDNHLHELFHNRGSHLGGAKKKEEMPAHNIVLPTSQNSSHWNPYWLKDACATRKDPESDQIWDKQDDWPQTTWKLTPLP